MKVFQVIRGLTVHNILFFISHSFYFKGYVKQGKKNFILVPIAFVNEHIETLHELDIEYCKELGEEVRLLNSRIQK